MSNAKFKLDSYGIEISGTESFVESQLDKFRDLIKASYEKILQNPTFPETIDPHLPLRRAVLETGGSHQPEDAEFVEVKDGEVRFDNVFVNEGGKFQIITDVPGNTTSSRMINIILILMWAKLKHGIETVPYSELRDACINYGDFDSSNFSRYMDQNKKYFLVLGDGKNRSAKLIRPGIKEAERLISELNKKTN